MCGAKTIVASARLALRFARRGHDHQLDVWRQLEPLRHGPRLEVVLLEQQLHVEPVLRVVQPLERFDEMLEHVPLVVEGHEHGVDRQLLPVQGGDVFVRNHGLARPG